MAAQPLTVLWLAPLATQSKRRMAVSLPHPSSPRPSLLRSPSPSHNNNNNNNNNNLEQVIETSIETTHTDISDDSSIYSGNSSLACSELASDDAHSLAASARHTRRCPHDDAVHFSMYRPPCSYCTQALVHHIMVPLPVFEGGKCGPHELVSLYRVTSFIQYSPLQANNTVVLFLDKRPAFKPNPQKEWSFTVIIDRVLPTDDPTWVYFRVDTLDSRHAILLFLAPQFLDTRRLPAPMPSPNRGVIDGWRIYTRMGCGCRDTAPSTNQPLRGHHSRFYFARRVPVLAPLVKLVDSLEARRQPTVELYDVKAPTPAKIYDYARRELIRLVTEDPIDPARWKTWKK